MRTILIQNLSNPKSTPITATYCDTFWGRFRGLMFQAPVKNGSGLLLVEKKESRAEAAIHMLFMRFDIGAIWINKKLKVADAKLAKRWMPVCVPSAPGQYILETHIDHLSDFRIGDQLEFKDV